MKSFVVTMGEPAGIGGEITLKSWLMRHGRNLPEFAVLDDPDRLKREAEWLGQKVPVEVIDDLNQVEEIFDKALPVMPLSSTVEAEPGKLSSQNGAAVLESIQKAVELCRFGKAAGMVTNPIHKAALYEAGFKHPGHTEYIAELCGAQDAPVMMLAAKNLRVVPLTIHISLKDVPGAITQELICEKTRRVHAALQKDFGLESPRIAMAGLNPHAGENGAIGSEEQDIIIPAIEVLKAEGIDVAGPHSADTMFHEQARARYDAALCMYHDQALIPLKSLDFYGGVNITLGLPVVRTSPDHGTALDIAGKGLARPDSLIEALITAAKISRFRES